MSKFLDRAAVECQHEFSPDYCDWGVCATPYCGWDEYRCIKCKAYIVECGCHYNDGLSGWPTKRWKRFWKKQERSNNRGLPVPNTPQICSPAI